MGKILIFILLYVAFPPGLSFGLRALKGYLKDALFGRQKSKTAINQLNMKEPLSVKLSKRRRFTLKDPRNKPIPYRLVYVGMYLLGLIGAGVAGSYGAWIGLPVALLLNYGSTLFAYFSANKIVSERDAVLKRMMELKQSKMGLMNKDRSVMPDPNMEFKVSEWAEDFINPIKMQIFMPTDFDLLSVDRFMESFNLIFGGNGQWVADDAEGGFDFNAGIASLKVSPKLPERADWNIRYLSEEDIHWSFFPLALGSENGVPVFNEETGQTERVLGFAVNGGQEKFSKKKGVNIGPEITSAPQILIAGGTGGGKSLHSQTKVKVIIE
jgi:hypothetical protein